MYRVLYFLRIHALLFCLIFVCSGIAVGVALFFLQFTFFAVISALLAVLFFEVTYRLIFLIGYGRDYRVFFEPYLIVDHPQYGRSLRANTSVREVKKMLFDKYIFSSLPAPIGSLEENIAARVDLNTDERGFRKNGRTKRKYENKVVIYCSGGSTTAGYGNDEDSWPAQLERLLNENISDQIQVINGGVWGFSSTEEFKRLSIEVEEIRPDIVLLHQGWNEEFIQSLVRDRSKARPNICRGKVEQELWLQPNSRLRRLSSFITFLVMAQAWKQYRLKSDLRFTNSERWKVLLRRHYVDVWLQNLLSFRSLAEKQGFLLYTINPPGLVSLQDSDEDRRKYLQGTRLTSLYAHYQALSREYISNTLSVCSQVIPSLNVADGFAIYRGEERKTLFRDEIHLTATGEARLAELLLDLLTSDTNFLSRALRDKSCKTNVSDVVTREKLLTELKKLDMRADETLRTIATRVAKMNSRADGDIPEDMYTVF